MERDGIKKAQATVRNLEGQKKLGARKRKRLEEAQRILDGRRKTIKFLVLGGLGLTVGGVALFSRNREQPAPLGQTEIINVPQPDVAESEPPSLSQAEAEKATDALIKRAEEGFEEFSSLMIPKIASISEPRLQEELMGPFEVFRLNRQNSNRNGPRLDREALAAGKRESILPNPYYFTYNATHLPPSYAASFIPPRRMMELALEFDGKNPIDTIVLYHELRHVIMDTNMRMEMPPQALAAYEAMFHPLRRPGERFRINVLEEIFAYGLEIEILDLYMDGALRRAFTGGGAPISPTEMLEKLKGRPGQLRIIIFLLELAEAYYPEGTQVDTRDGRIFVQRKFMDKVAAKMKGLGFEPYTFDPVHGAQPYNGLDL